MAKANPTRIVAEAPEVVPVVVVETPTEETNEPKQDTAPVLPPGCYRLPSGTIRQDN